MRLAMTQSMPAMTSLVRPEPREPSTRTSISRTDGALPPANAGVTDGRRGPVAADDAGDVRAVAERIAGRRPVRPTRG